MDAPIYLYDPTVRDQLSAVRGIGRYVDTLKAILPNCTVTADIASIPYESVFINPFFDFLKPPLTRTRIARQQVAVVHDLIPLKYSRKFPAGWRGNWNIFRNNLALKSYTHIITDSYASRDDIKQILRTDPAKITVAYPPLPEPFIHAESASATLSDKKLKIPKEYCIYVGDATWNKNLIALAKAVKLANVSCVVVGKVFATARDLNHPWNFELREFLRATRGDKRFVFTGFVSNDDLVTLYRNATVNVLPSRDEGFGYSYIEAGACGTPSVLADISVFREVSKNCALFADPDNPADIAAKIKELFIDRAQAEQLGTRTRDRSLSFTAKSFRKMLSNIL